MDKKGFTYHLWLSLMPCFCKIAFTNQLSYCSKIPASFASHATDILSLPHFMWFKFYNRSDFQSDINYLALWLLFPPRGYQYRQWKSFQPKWNLSFKEGNLFGFRYLSPKAQLYLDSSLCEINNVVHFNLYGKYFQTNSTRYGCAVLH